MNKKLSAFLVLISLGGTVFADTNFKYSQTQTQPVYDSKYYPQADQYNNYNVLNHPLQGNVTMVPSGTSVKAVVTAPISSETASVGQPVYMALNSDFYYNNKLIAPAGSTIIGAVIEVSKAKRGGINGKLCVRFNQISTPYGTTIPISAVIKTDDSSGVLIGGTKLDVTKEYAKDLAAGSAAGALSGLVFGALAGGDVGKGTALGTAVGAGGGLVKSVWDKGNDVVLPANAGIDLILTQPLTMSGI